MERRLTCACGAAGIAPSLCTPTCLGNVTPYHDEGIRCSMVVYESCKPPKGRIGYAWLLVALSKRRDGVQSGLEWFTVALATTIVDQRIVGRATRGVDLTAAQSAQGMLGRHALEPAPVERGWMNVHVYSGERCRISLES